MQSLNIAGSIASLLSLAISVFVAFKVIRIGNSIHVKGSRNVTVGRDANFQG